MVLTNNGRTQVVSTLQSLFTTGGVGLDNTSAALTDSELFGGGTTIDACDSSTGWSTEGDASSVALNTTSGEAIEGSDCLNLITSHSTGSAGFYKTISSKNLSNKKMNLWFYINNSNELASSSNAITITLGTSGFTNSNDYYTSYEDISNGWNSIYFDVEADSDNTNGTGLVSSDCDRIKITVLASSTQSSNDMRMDFWTYYESGTLGLTDSNNTLTIETGDYYIKTTHNITTNESNGVDIVESGDNDGTYLLSRQVFAPLNKGVNTELQVDKYYYIE